MTFKIIFRFKIKIKYYTKSLNSLFYYIYGNPSPKPTMIGKYFFDMCFINYSLTISIKSTDNFFFSVCRMHFEYYQKVILFNFKYHFHNERLTNERLTRGCGSTIRIRKFYYNRDGNNNYYNSHNYNINRIILQRERS